VLYSVTVNVSVQSNSVESHCQLLWWFAVSQLWSDESQSTLVGILWGWTCDLGCRYCLIVYCCCFSLSCLLIIAFTKDVMLFFFVHLSVVWWSIIDNYYINITVKWLDCYDSFGSSTPHEQSSIFIIISS